MRLSMSGIGLLAAAAVALPAMVLAPGAVNAASLGYGDFLGVWTGNYENRCNSPGDPVSGADCLESLIKAAYPSTPPHDTLGDPGVDEFDNQFNPVGKIDGPSPGTHTDNLLSVDVDDDQMGGTWTYLPGNPVAGDDPVDFYLILKWAQDFAVFFYPSVLPNDMGDWTTKQEVLFTQFNVLPCSGDYDGTLCAPVGPKGQNQTVSHIEAFWPPTDAPEPASLALLGMGLLGLGLMRRRCRA